MDRVGLVFLDRPSLSEQIELVQHAEQRGFESVWVCETRLVRDAVGCFRSDDSTHQAGHRGRQQLDPYSWFDGDDHGYAA